ncbi:substrate-binding periplasmic protein [uncultured Psychrobacter sp.]|uniref:substrate-binding periplasmic protein n=1 Tax=uncultured Psychrobacter sp. TaxID=259303 RepID=UPI003459BF63
MKQLYRVLPVALSVGLFGCGNTNTTTQQSTTVQESTTPVAPKVIETEEEPVSKLPDTAPVVTVASDPDYAPYVFKNEYGNMTGFEIELVRSIGEDQGFKVENYNHKWEFIYDVLDTKKRDMIAAGIPYSSENASKYLISDPYAPLPPTVVYLDDSLNIKSLNDLSNVKIGTTVNTIEYDLFSSGDFAVKSVDSYDTIFQAVQALAQGKVDAVAGDSGVLRYTLNDLPELKPIFFDYRELNEPASRIGYVIDKDQPELLAKVNAGLKNLKENGTYATLTTKWFGKDLTADVLEQEKILEAASAP